MGGTGWAWRGSRDSTQENCGVFTAGICTIVTWTLLLVVQQLAAQRLVEALDGVLGAAVRGLQRDAAVGQRRADLDDGAAVARLACASARPSSPYT